MERREHDRYAFWFPVQVETVSMQEGMGVSHDTSRTGILLALAAPLAVDADVTLTFRIPPDSPSEHRVRGRVVRVEPNAADPDGLWPHKVAVVFDEPQPAIEEALVCEAGPRGP